MKCFQEFLGKFVDYNDTVSGETVYCFLRITIDLLCVAGYNETDAELTSIDLIGGSRYTLKIKYDKFKELMESTKLTYSQS